MTAVQETQYKQELHVGQPCYRQSLSRIHHGIAHYHLGHHLYQQQQGKEFGNQTYLLIIGKLAQSSVYQHIDDTEAYDEQI